MAKSKTLSWYKKKCVEMAKTIAKTRDKYICQKCGKTREQAQIHGSHVYPVRYGILASDPDNIIALCAGCHDLKKDSWHGSPLESAEWFEQHYPGKKDELKLRMNQVPEKLTIVYWEERYHTLREIIKTL